MTIQTLKNIGGCLIFVLFTSWNANAQIDTVKVPDTKLETQWFKPGLKQYLIYSQNPAKKTKLFFWLWTRYSEVKEIDHKKIIELSQHWYAADTLNYREVFSINRYSDFAPIYHKEVVRGKINAYNWSAIGITGADSVPSNSKTSFKLAFQKPNLNWNLDIETFEMLPLAMGKVFAINFYDAGLDPPEYFIYKVSGSEMIGTYDGKTVDCWKLVTAGHHGGMDYSETYWISKSGHEFLKEEDSYGSSFRYKVKMPASATEFVGRLK